MAVIGSLLDPESDFPLGAAGSDPSGVTIPNLSPLDPNSDPDVDAGSGQFGIIHYTCVMIYL